MRDRGVPLTWLALGLVAIVQVTLLGRLGEPSLVGWETHPQIAAARALSWGDVFGVLGSKIESCVLPISYYRPVYALSLAIDHALFGVAPLGYRVSDALLAAGAALTVFGLTRRLLGPSAQVGPWVALATFLLLPVHAEVLPVVARRMDMLCTLFASLALFAQASRLDGPLSWRSSWPALFTLLATGAKETGLVVAPLVVLLALLFAASTSPRAHLLRAARIALPHFLAVAIVFAARWVVLGELGSHGSIKLYSGLTRLPAHLGVLFIRLTSLLENADVPTRAQWVAVLGAVLLWTGVLVWLMVLVRLAKGESGPSRKEDRGRIPLAFATLLLSGSWIALVGFVYAVNGVIEPWYYVMPGQAFALGLGACAEPLWSLRHTRLRAASAAGLAVLVVLIGAQARWSPLVRGFGHWSRAQTLTARYFVELSREIESAEPGDVVWVTLPPFSLKTEPNTLGARRADILHLGSLPAWAELHFPNRRIEFRHQKLGNASNDPAADAIVVRFTGPRRAREAHGR